ncbi:MAG: long-chain fatty acid--CoA ligase [Thermodesulfobacteriota bacterium]
MDKVREGRGSKKKFITPQEAITLPGLFRARVQDSPQAPAYQEYDHTRGSWQSYSWGEMAELVGRWRQGLVNLGLTPGARVALYLPNSVAWVCCEQAALALGLITVPLYHLDSPANVAFILHDSGASLLLVAQPEQWQKLAPWHDKLPELSQVLCLDRAGEQSGQAKVMAVPDWLAKEPAAAPEEEPELTGEGLATLIYTSGTTGNPKGVMLSHQNILHNGEMVQQVVPALGDDTFLSFLPLSHSFERTVGYYMAMMSGAQVAFCRSTQDLAEDLLTVRPTVLISVPRIYEKVYGRIQEGLAAKGRLARLLFRTAVAVGWRRFLADQGRGAERFSDRLLWPLLRGMVGEKIMAKLGGRLRLAVTGGASLHPKVARLFIGLGLPLVQGYGLTECGPVVSTNRLADNLPSSVGRPLPGTETRLASGGELEVRSPSVMIGYWQQPEAFRNAVDQEGWLATGDVVEEDEEGHLIIRGRCKEILVTSTGEKVPPTDLEAAISEDPLFQQAMIIGEAKPYLAALIVLEASAWQDLARKLDLDPDAPASLSAPQLQQEVLARLAQLLASFPSYAQVRAVHLSCEPWRLRDGLVTSLLKLRREEIKKRFARQIAHLYVGHDLSGAAQGDD